MKLWFALSLQTALALALLLGRVLVSDSTSYAFLPWNLFLAWIPFAVAEVLRILDDKRRLGPLLGGALGAVWLGFLPNAPYVITDFLHLHERARVPMWFDAVLIAVYAATSAVLGLASIERVHAIVQRRLGVVRARAFVVVTVALCGLGIYLGRFVRFNTWDLVDHPRRVFFASARAMTEPGSFASIAVFSAVLFVAYVTYRALRPDPIRDGVQG